MVKKIFNFIGRESNGLHQAAYFLGIFAFLSQILGLFRDKLLAHNFGAGLELDLYYAAFRIPDFIFVSVASLVSVSVLIPVLIKNSQEKSENQKFINNIFSFFFLIVIISSGIVFLFAPFIMKLLFPTFSPENYSKLVLLTRILLLSPIFLGFSNLFSSIVQAHQRFILYSLSPIIYNLGIISGIILLVPRFGILGVVLGVVAGALGHLAIQIPFVLKVGLFPKFSFRNLWLEIKNILYISVPRTITLSSHNLALLFLFSLASLLDAGSITIFSFSLNIQSVPLSIFGVSYSLAAFPTLSRFFLDKEHIKFAKQIATAGKHIIFWSLPVAVLFIVLRAQIIRVILGSGEFSWSDTRLTAACLAIFAVSIVPQSLNLLFTRGYYAAQNTKKPLFINILSSVLIVIFSFTLIKIFQQNEFFRFFIEALLRVEGLEGSTILMIPLGYSLGIILNSLMFLFLFKIDFKGSQEPVVKTFFQSFSASIIMGFVTYIFLNILTLGLDTNTFFGVFLQGFLAGIIGILSGIFVLMTLNNPEIKDIWSNLHKRFWEAKAIGSDSKIV